MPCPFLVEKQARVKAVCEHKNRRRYGPKGRIFPLLFCHTSLALFCLSIYLSTFAASAAPLIAATITTKYNSHFCLFHPPPTLVLFYLSLTHSFSHCTHAEISPIASYLVLMSLFIVCMALLSISLRVSVL